MHKTLQNEGGIFPGGIKRPKRSRAHSLAISKALRGRKFSPEHREHLSKAKTTLTARQQHAIGLVLTPACLFGRCGGCVYRKLAGRYWVKNRRSRRAGKRLIAKITRCMCTCHDAQMGWLRTAKRCKTLLEFLEVEVRSKQLTKPVRKFTPAKTES